MADLLPCPFCASPNPAVLPRTCNQDTPYSPMDRAFPEVRCRGCHASVPGDNWGKPESAINAWNTRPAQRPSQEVVEIAVRGYPYYIPETRLSENGKPVRLHLPDCPYLRCHPNKDDCTCPEYEERKNEFEKEPKS